MKICFFGIYDRSYSRNSILLEGLRQNGVEIIECQADWRDPKRYQKLWRALKALDGRYDLIYTAYPSSVPTIIARLISKKLIVADAFYSMFDSVVNDRQKFGRWSFQALKLLAFDWLGVIFAHVVIADTDEHRKYWHSWWGMSRKKIHVAYIGYDDKLFRSVPPVKKDHILVNFHGTFIPLQGVTKIVEAARLCADDPRIKFRLIGDGRDMTKAKALIGKYNLKNIELTGMMPPEKINAFIAESDITLGIFGDTAKAKRVIPNKVYECMAVGRAVITADTPAIREIFTDKDLMIVKSEPQAIADAIKLLAKNEKLREDIARQGYATVSKYDPAGVGKSLIQALS
jgi:glycosyltransferase involved in cell wall biosynthesis